MKLEWWEELVEAEEALFVLQSFLLQAGWLRGWFFGLSSNSSCIFSFKSEGNCIEWTRTFEFIYLFTYLFTERGPGLAKSLRHYKRAWYRLKGRLSLKPFYCLVITRPHVLWQVAGFVLGSPKIRSSAILVNSQLVHPPTSWDSQRCYVPFEVLLSLKNPKGGENENSSWGNSTKI